MDDRVKQKRRKAPTCRWIQLGEQFLERRLGINKQNKIVELVHEYMDYPSGKHRHYLPVNELHLLFRLMMETGETAACVKVIPFYVSTHRRLEFDEYMLIVKRLSKGKTKKDFFQSCVVEESERPDKSMIRCYSKRDIKSFHRAIQEYLEYVDTIIVHEIYEVLVKECGIRNEDLLLGDICFEVHVTQ